MGRKSQADERFEAEIRALGHAVLALEREAGDNHLGVKRLTDVRFKLDADNRTSVLLVLKGVEGEVQSVAFVGGSALSSVLQAAGKKLAADALRWREDRPWEPGG